MLFAPPPPLPRAASAAGAGTDKTTIQNGGETPAAGGKSKRQRAKKPNTQPPIKHKSEKQQQQWPKAETGEIACSAKEPEIRGTGGKGRGRQGSRSGSRTPRDGSVSQPPPEKDITAAGSQRPPRR